MSATSSAKERGTDFPSFLLQVRNQAIVTETTAELLQKTMIPFSFCNNTSSDCSTKHHMEMIQVDECFFYPGSAEHLNFTSISIQSCIKPYTNSKSSRDCAGKAYRTTCLATSVAGRSQEFFGSGRDLSLSRKSVLGLLNYKSQVHCLVLAA